MKKLLIPLVLVVMLQVVPAYADVISFGDFSGFIVGQYVDGTYTNASFVSGSSSFMGEGQAITLWSGHSFNGQHGYGWRYDEQSHFGAYIDFDAGKGSDYYAAGLSFEIPVTGLMLNYVMGNEYKVRITYADGSSEIVTLGNDNGNGSSGWGNLYGVEANGGIVDLAFFYDKKLDDKSNAQYLGLLALNYTTNIGEPVPTPLPGTFWLMGSGMSAYAAYARRKKAKA